MNILYFENGMTIKELKDVLMNWPETDEDGEPTTVWINTGRNLSSIVVEISPLNKQENSADLLLISSAFETD